MLGALAAAAWPRSSSGLAALRGAGRWLATTTGTPSAAAGSGGGSDGPVHSESSSPSSLPPGAAYLASLVDHERQGVPPAAGVAPPPAAAASDGGGPGQQQQQRRPFDLATMRALLAAMGDPQRRLRAVHVAGTKGKGSVTAMLSGVLRAAGYRVGTYTSPHLFDVRERVVVGGGGGEADNARGGGDGGDGRVPAARAVSAAQWEALAVRARDAARAAALPAPPSHFEATTAMALAHFADERCDAVVVEAGLGGATDATNVWDQDDNDGSGSSSCHQGGGDDDSSGGGRHHQPHPQLQAAVLTAVGLDHVAALGGSLESIARAKAGVMRAGAPLVVGRQGGGGAAAAAGGSSSGSSEGAAAAETVWRVLREAAAAFDPPVRLVAADEAVHVTPAAEGGGITVRPGPGASLAEQRVDVASAAPLAPGEPPLRLRGVPLRLVGAHQADNAAAAVAAALELRRRGGWERVTPAAVAAGLAAAWLPGRFQVVLVHPQGDDGGGKGSGGGDGGSGENVSDGGGGHYVVLDGAHTGESAAALAAAVRQAFPEPTPVVLVLAMAADKPHRAVCEALRGGVRPAVAVFTSAPVAGSHARSAPPGALAAQWQAAAMTLPARPPRCRELIQANLGAALDKAAHELRGLTRTAAAAGDGGGGAAGRAPPPRGVVLVTGSLHAVAAAMRRLCVAPPALEE